MVHMWIDERGSEVLMIPECRRMLALGAKQGRHGHLGIPQEGAPLVLPVDYAGGRLAVASSRAADGVTVLHASGSGDDTLLAVTANAAGQVTLVSADRALCQRAEALGADVAGPGWLIDLLGK